MKKYLEKSGKTEDEALAAALRELGLDRDDVSVEIVERAKSGFLGIGASPAVVRVEYDAPDEEPVKEAPAAPVSEPPRAEKKAEKAAEPAAPAVSTEPKYPEGVKAHTERVLRGLLLQNTAKFPQLPQQVDGLRHTGAVQQRRRGGIRRLVPQPPQADQLRLQFLEQRHQLGALCRVYRVLQAVLQYLKGVLHAVKRAPEPPAQSPAQGQQCCILVPSVHGKRLLS